MTAERWPEVDRVLQAALAQPPAAREGFVRETCVEDAALRDEVLSILAHADSAEGFLERPSAQTHSALQRGQQIGSHSEVARIGAGGGGEIYRASAFPVNIWVLAALGAAGLKAVAAVAVALAGGDSGSATLPYSTIQYAALVFTFSATGITLVAARTGDVRAVWLGCVLALTAAPFAETLISCCTGTHMPLGTFVRGLGQLPVVPVLPVFFWLFVRQFPEARPAHLDPRPARLATVAALVLALVLVASNLSEMLWPAARPEDWRGLLSRRRLGSLFWPLIISASLPALAFLIWNARSVRPSEHRRVRMFVAGLALGFAPLALTILAGILVPAYARLVASSSAAAWEARIVFICLAAVPFVTAYSVLVDRVIEIRLVIRAALQYAMARYTLLALIGVPLATLVWNVYQHREQRIWDLLAGANALVLAAVIFGAALGLRVRSRALNALDRRFFREQYDARQILNALADRCRKATTVDELVGLVSSEIDRALHVDYVTMLLSIRDDGVLRSPDGRIRPLSRSSGLALLAKGDTSPLAVDLESADSTLRRLPEEERLWLADAGFGLLVPLTASNGLLLGLIGLGHKLSELPFSKEDRLLLEAIGAAVSLTVENRHLRESSDVRGRTPARAGAPERVDDGRPAKECEECGRVHPPDATICDCGTEVVPTVVPYVLGGKFHLDRRIGRGGMGVVYRALDPDLGRHVAVKTLPRVGPEGAARLRREAKAMGAVLHENLAVIFEVTSWLGTPMLIVELFEGGTLADRLRSGPIVWQKALDTVIAVSRGVEHLHRAGLLHCDIKPSNIAFTRDGVPKLLDFGVATILHDRLVSGSTTTRSGGVPRRSGEGPSDGTKRREFAGTPPYMSPEALDGRTPRPAFDVWALSIVLFESIAGTKPFRGDSLTEVIHAVNEAAVPDIRALCPACPSEFSAFFKRALSRRPADRPQTAAHLRADLFRLQGL